MRKINIITPSRIHLALIDLNGSLGRVDGGIGLTLSYSGFNISARYSDSTEIIGSSDSVLRAEKIVELLQRKYDIGNVRIKVEENIVACWFGFWNATFIGDSPIYMQSF